MQRLFLSLGVLVSAALCQAQQPQNVTNRWNVTAHLPLDRFIIQSHRGAGTLAPENTIDAFELGWKLRTYPEADVRTTKDGVLVAFHDPKLARVVPNAPAELKSKGVHELTFEEVSRLDVGSWAGKQFRDRRVPRLSEVFALMKGKPERRLYLDIKDVKLPQLAQAVKDAGVQPQVVLAAPNPATLRQWKALVPESETLLWMSGSEPGIRLRLDPIRKSNFDGITQLQVHIHPNRQQPGDPFTLSNRFLVDLGHELRSRNILFQALPYTADAGVYAKLLDLGLASFATDHPETAWREIKAYYASKTRN
jgi:glycerophosphoryl diester phosphodiesterase